MCYEWNILCCPLLCDIFLKLHVFSQEEEDSQVFVCLFVFSPADDCEN